MKELQFTKSAENALTSLQIAEQDKALQMIRAFAENKADPILANKTYKLSNSKGKIYALRLTHNLRIVIELVEDLVVVIDIINHDLFERYFKREK